MKRVNGKMNLSAGNDIRPAPDTFRHYCLNKKGQEEIIGFILIVVMVMVIGLVFLFFMSPRQTETKDPEIENLLYSWLATNIEGSDVKGIISHCYTECDLSNAVVILDSAVTKSGLINRVNGYSLNITGTTEFSYAKGNLTGNARTAVVPLEDNEVKLKFFYQ